MNILQLCNKPPCPSVDGGTMAMDSITQGLLGLGHRVRVLTVETDKHPMQRSRMPEGYAEQTGIESVYVDLGVRVLPAAVAMLCGESYHVKRYVSNDFAQKLKEVLQEEDFDVVHIESIFLTPYVPLIRRLTKAAVVLRAHNVEHLIWRRVAEHTPHGMKRGYLKHLSLTLRAYELEHINDFDGVVCITQEDADYFRSNGCRRPIMVLPMGVKVDAQPPCEVDPTALFHIGAMDWMPNQEGVEWLIAKVWPLIHQVSPTAHLHLAGRKMPDRMRNWNVEGVTVEGEVADAKSFMADKQISIVPLLSGSGMRVKIIEAMSMGKTVVSTRIGAQGIDYTDGVDLLIADSPEDFARQVSRCIEDPQYSRNIGMAGARLVERNYDLHTLATRLTTFYNRTIENR